MEPLLEINGEVNRGRAFDFEALKALPGQVPEVAREIPGREGGGVRLTSVLDAVAPRDEAAYITLSTGNDDFSASVPLKAVREQGIVVYRLGDAPLPEDKGGPVRFFIVDVEACGLTDGSVDQCANVKHLGRITLSAERGPDTRPATVREHVEIHPHHAAEESGSSA